MYRLIETINLTDGKFLNLDLHVNRMNLSRQSLGGSTDTIDISCLDDFSTNFNQGIYKVRILYSNQIEEVSCEEYTIKSINSLKLVVNDQISYPFKYEDRSAINDLYHKRRSADDILIVKNGLLTDSSYCNVALYDGELWVTPKNPLLKGTMRSSLLSNNTIIEKNIDVNSIDNYSHISLFNAMIKFQEINLVLNKSIIY